MSFVIIFSWQCQENHSGNAELMTLANLVATLLDVIECKINVYIVISAIIRIIIATSTDNYYGKNITNYQLTFHKFAFNLNRTFVATLGLYALRKLCMFFFIKPNSSKEQLRSLCNLCQAQGQRQGLWLGRCHWSFFSFFFFQGKYGEVRYRSLI